MYNCTYSKYCMYTVQYKYQFPSKLTAQQLLHIWHRIKDDRMENSIKGIQIWHCAFATSIILCSTPT